jgi:putative ABC transport system permease protein
MAAAVIDRAREIGMLRAIGATRRQVATAVVVEAGFLGFAAAVTGISLGIVECHLFLRTLMVSGTGWHIAFTFPWGATIRIASLVIVTSAIAGGIPALRASRTQMASALAVE